jgi:hypothetical protein
MRTPMAATTTASAAATSSHTGYSPTTPTMVGTCTPSSTNSTPTSSAFSTRQNVSLASRTVGSTRPRPRTPSHTAAVTVANTPDACTAWAGTNAT